MPNKPHRNKHKYRAKSKPRHVADVMQRLLSKAVTRVGTPGPDASRRTAMPELPSVSASWRTALVEALDPELGPHIANVLVKPRELVVFTESAAWCTRLKLSLAQIDAVARARDPGITRVQVRVMPAGSAR